MPSFRTLALASATLLSFAAAPQAAAQWTEATSKHFIVVADMPEPQLRRYTERLERFDAAMRLIARAPERIGDEANRVTVIVLPSMGDVQRYAGNPNVGGVYRPNAQGSVAIMPRTSGNGQLSADVIMYHEYAHHILMSNSADFYPRWLNEGLAEFFGNSRVQDNGSVTLGLPNLERGYTVMDDFSMSVEEMIRRSNQELSAADTGQLYARGWLLVHYLLLSGERPGQFDAYLKALRTKGDPIKMAEAAFGDLGKLNSELNAYRRRRQLIALPIKAEQLKPSPVVLRRLPAAEASMMPLRTRSAFGVDERAGQALIAPARAIASANLGNAWIQRVLAEMEFDVRNNAEAEAAADRALAADPKMADAMIYKGRVIARRAAASKDAKEWQAARDWFLRANRAAPEWAMPYVAFYDSFLRAGQSPSPGSFQGMRRAIQLVPDDRGLRPRLAYGLLKANDLAGAREELEAIARSAHGSNGPPLEMIKLLDAKAPVAQIVGVADKAGWPAIWAE